MFDPYLEADKLNITVHEAPLSPGLRGFYHRDATCAIILLNRSLTPVQKRCTLAHELEHHHYAVVNNIAEAIFCYRDKINNCKNERMIATKAVLRLIPGDELGRFIEQSPEAVLEDLTEAFDVTLEVAVLRFELLSIKGR